MNGQANIAELQGEPGSSAALDRKAGFEEVLKKYPNMKIVITQTGMFKRAKGKEVMEAFLKGQAGKINAVFAHNDDMAIGAIQAIKEAGLKPGKDIIVVSVDGIKDAFTALVAGELNYSVECNPLLGKDLFTAMKKAIKGEKMDKKLVMQDQAFEHDDAVTLIAGRKY